MFRPRWNNEERGVVGVVVRAVRYVDGVVGAVLGVVLVEMLGRLRDVLRGGLAGRMEEYDLRNAREIAEQTVEWDYGATRRWTWVPGFVMCVTMIDVDRLAGSVFS